jgi:hypothetical protein
MAYDAVNKKIGQYEYITIGGKPQRRLGALLDYNTVRHFVRLIVSTNKYACFFIVKDFIYSKRGALQTPISSGPPCLNLPEIVYIVK